MARRRGYVDARDDLLCYSMVWWAALRFGRGAAVFSPQACSAVGVGPEELGTTTRSAPRER